MSNGKTFGLRLSPEIVRAVEGDARAAGVTPTEYLRVLVVNHYAPKNSDESQRRVIYEIAKNRSVLLRYIDAQLGEAKADELLRAAEQDARAYLETAGDGAEVGPG